MADTTVQGPTRMGLFRLTWPIFLELLLFMMMGTADTLMLSGVSDDAVSAVGVVNQYLFICILIMEVVSNGASVVVSQYLGARRSEEAARISAVAITLNLLLGVTVSAGLLLFGDALLLRMNLHGIVLEHARTYMGIAGGFIFLQALINVCSSLIRTYGFTRESMFIALGMNALHVGGNALLIFGLLGVPRLEVAGAALSTVGSRAVALVVFAWLLYRVMDVKMRARDYVTFSRDTLRKILRVGIPSAVEQGTYQSCQAVFLYYVTFLGPTALASRQYANAISQYIFLFSLAVGMGTAIIVGRLVGAGQVDEAYRRVLQSLKWAVAITFVVDVAAILVRAPLVGLFTHDGDIVRLTSQVIVMGLLLETGRSFNLVLVNALRSAGDAPFTVYMGFLSMVCMSLPLGYVLVFKLNLGLAGVWLAVAADEWLRGISMWIRWKSRAWEQKSLVDPVEAPAVVAVVSA
ncbi:MATE family efflux transporter [Myxococcus llanfairpwllgwyngyllgogerychwyrndrobwllllantysiliogogogochensis]|uniref:MATE family efflux transporter n=1 Tax=Myxococcus llanfairpwllgwyngyllgogerychwyrndrobwllllantysiliogogogochensis TaxID=2590453 RepID=A0A540X7T5_9BACT|nr:MATE family efflux transporter [Myxococcus llanfairpwllgwyngyllgogerychwyrndrobwllllantysiliogogogochensis]TQF17262.1 MATE family efflux transporter [Myxococcus llanfairpwllgwyngyllgogerychwyrndrobwllllantysiliogogogochensis]